MIPLITLVDPIVFERPPDPDEIDPEDAIAGARLAGYDDLVVGSIAAHAAHLPVADADEQPIHWSVRDVRHLRFLRRLVRDRRLEGDTKAVDE